MEPFVCIQCGRRTSEAPQNGRCLKCGGESVGEYSIAKAAQFMLSTDDLEGLPPEVEAAYRSPNSIFGRYVLIKLVGRGGAAEVWKAWHTTLKKAVAVKRIYSLNPDAILRLQREARNASRLAHPNIVGIHDMGFVEIAGVRWYYIAMDYIPGVPLNRTRFPLEQKVQMIRDIANALQFAHDHRIVHRDIKPGNILVDARGRAYLTDFGLARQVDDPRLTVTDVIVGTPVYMSPEQAQGWSQEIDARSDVYSLGATLYEVLTGIPPFQGDNSFEVLNNVVKLAPISPRSLSDEVDPRLESICLRAMEKDKAKRFQTARELSSELTRHLQGHSRSFGQTVYKAVRDLRRQSVTAALMLLLAAMVGSASFLVWQVLTPRLQPQGASGPAAPVEEPRSSAAERLWRARDLIDRHDRLAFGPPEAADAGPSLLEAASDALSGLPEEAEVRLARGRILRRRLRFQEAAQELTASIREHPQGRAYAERAWTRADGILFSLLPHAPAVQPIPRDHWESAARSALQDISEARARGFAGDADAAYVEALGRAASGRWSEALAGLAAVLNEAGADLSLSLRAHSLTGDVLLFSGVASEAIREYEAVVERKPGDPAAASRLLRAHQSLLEGQPPAHRTEQDLADALRVAVAPWPGERNAIGERLKGTLLLLVAEARFERRDAAEAQQLALRALDSLQRALPGQPDDTHYHASRAHFLLAQLDALGSRDPRDAIRQALMHCKLDTHIRRARALEAEILALQKRLAMD